MTDNEVSWAGLEAPDDQVSTIVCQLAHQVYLTAEMLVNLGKGSRFRKGLTNLRELDYVSR